jgi:hypothetical protein
MRTGPWRVSLEARHGLSIAGWNVVMGRQRAEPANRLGERHRSDERVYLDTEVVLCGLNARSTRAGSR